MKQSIITILLTLLMSMTGAKALAFSVANSDGVTIYYKWANEEKTELAVTYYSSTSYYGSTTYQSNYSGNILIPESVVYEGNTYNVTSIGDHAFYECGGLTSVTIPNSVTSIGNSAFSYCSGLTSVTIPNSVTSIGDHAFYRCGGLASITISNNLTSISSSAFESCGLNSVTIPNSVKFIGSKAFYMCGKLTSVIIGSGVSSIGENAFYYTNLKKTIWLTNTPPADYTRAGGSINYVSNNQFTSFKKAVKYQFLSSYFEVDGIRYVPVSPSERTCDAIDCVYDESAANTKIASTVLYKGVTMNVMNIKPYLANNKKFMNTLSIDIEGSLPDYAFTGCSNLKNVTYSDKINGIGYCAFQDCSSLISLTATENVPYSKALYISKNIDTIGDNAFSGCKEIKNVIIADSEGTLTFGSNGKNPIFSSCPLDYVYIGRDISYKTGDSYGYSPFYRNTTLREVKITDKETEISENEFYGCTNLQKITIGDGVTTIGKRAFSGCSSLLYFAFGTQVADIGEEAFSDCAAMVEVISKAQNPPVCGSQALDDINKFECKLYVPDGYMAVYEVADQWKDFFFKDEGEGTASQGESGEQTVNKCETPTISFDGDKLSFACATEGVAFHYTISHSDVKSGISSKAVDLAQTYNITVYASKDGYNDSEVAKATLKASNSVLLGDVDGDGIVNVADHVKLSDIILNK
jgi:hypothetical protein